MLIKVTCPCGASFQAAEFREAHQECVYIWRAEQQRQSIPVTE